MSYRHIEALKIGGGYGVGAVGLSPEGGATLTNDGDLSIDGDLVVDGAASFGLFSPDSIDIGGGYGGGSGCSIASDGDISTNGTLTVDAITLLTGDLSVGGGYGDSGLTLYATGGLSANGALVIDGAGTIAGNVTLGAVGGSAGTVTLTGSTSGTATIAADATCSKVSIDKPIDITGNITSSAGLVGSTLAIGGGFGSSGFSCSAAGELSTNGSLVLDGGIQSGKAGGSSGQILFVGSTSGSASLVVAADASALRAYCSFGATTSLTLYGATSGSCVLSVAATGGALYINNAVTVASFVCTAGATFGGGYGSTGATISTAGAGQFNSTLQVDSTITSGLDGSANGSVQCRSTTASRYAEMSYAGFLQCTNETTGTMDYGHSGSAGTGTFLIRFGRHLKTSGSANYNFCYPDGTGSIVTASIRSSTGTLNLGANGTAGGSIQLYGSTSGTQTLIPDATSTTITASAALKSTTTTLALTGLLAGSNGGTAGSLTLYGSTSGNAVLTVDATTSKATLNKPLECTSTEISCSGGGLVAGTTGTSRGYLKLWRGSGGNTPGYAMLETTGGSEYYLFLSNAGLVRRHTSAPSTTLDGAPVSYSGAEIGYSSLSSKFDTVMTAASTWYPIMGLSTTAYVGEDAVPVYSAGVSNYIAVVAGTYLVEYEISGYTDTTGQEIHIGFGINGADPTGRGIMASAISGAVNNPRIWRASAIISGIAESDVLRPYVYNHTSAGKTLSIDYGTFRMTRIA